MTGEKGALTPQQALDALRPIMEGLDAIREAVEAQQMTFVPVAAALAEQAATLTPVPSEVAETTAGERCPRNPYPPHQRCENVVCDGNHRDYPADPRKDEARWTTPAEPDAGEVEALAKVLSGATPEFATRAAENHMTQARRLLASDWLAARDDRVRREDAVSIEALVKVLAQHAGCVANDSRSTGWADGSGVTGVDVWSCGIEIPFVEDLEVMERLHLATAITRNIQ